MHTVISFVEAHWTIFAGLVAGHVTGYLHKAWVDAEAAAKKIESAVVTEVKKL